MKFLWIILVLLAGGCATTIVPPTDVRTPATVYVLDAGRHSALVIPNQQGGMTRYAYGDWDWFALRKTGLLHGIAGLCWPTQGALGRERLRAAPDAAALVKQLPYVPENVYAVVVEREKALELGRRLDHVFVAEAETYHDQPKVALEFVHYPEPYWALHDSNHMTAKWLREMGVKTHGCALLSIWKISSPPAPPPPSR